ncbi:BEN domain-containing protein 7 isoform 2-T2 [Odontesthes bonariensis]
MELGGRKRRRKSQSFKLVTDEDSDPSYIMNSSCKYANGETKDAAVPDVWLGDKGMEIKKQITGMMRLLSDKTGRVYQRVGTEQESSTSGPQDRHLNWIQQPPILPLVSEDHQSNNWSSAGDREASSSSTSTPIPNGPGCGQYSTCSRPLRILNNTKDLIKANEANDVLPPAVQEAPCCMCNCKGTLTAILQELRTMRRLMQTQKGAPGLKAAPAESGKSEESEKLDSATPNSHPVSCDVSVLPSQNNPAVVCNAQNPLLNKLWEPQASELAQVRLAEDYDVFISKVQLDSILVNYTRSGSLLFRKLVCAFFNDATLANSLPNGKRKRGLNDNRKGLDQNIVGAIKVFTEKYCTEHRIEKLPGPRDWVQILQDQIKLARKRLKRDAAEAEKNSNGPSTSCDYK